MIVPLDSSKTTNPLINSTIILLANAYHVLLTASKNINQNESYINSNILKQQSLLLVSLEAQIHPNCTCTCKRLPCATKVVIVHTRTECVTKFSKSIFLRLFHQLAFRFEILFFAHHKLPIEHQNFLFVRSKIPITTQVMAV